MEAGKGMTYFIYGFTFFSIILILTLYFMGNKNKEKKKFVTPYFGLLLTVPFVIYYFYVSNSFSNVNLKEKVDYISVLLLVLVPIIFFIISIFAAFLDVHKKKDAFLWYPILSFLCSNAFMILWALRIERENRNHLGELGVLPFLFILWIGGIAYCALFLFCKTFYKIVSSKNKGDNS